jgi:hypothetical protein
MSTIIRRRRSSRTNLGPYKRFELLTGTIRYPLPEHYSGYGDGRSTNVADFISDEMRRDWATNRDALRKFWQSGECASHVFPDELPWLAPHGSADSLPWAAPHLD